MDQKGKKYPVSSSDYKLYEEVGEGVSATVYRALCIPFNEIVAIKVLDLDKCNSSLDGIRREVQTMSLINHPNVLRAHCSFVEKHSLWVVMPYMSGGSCLHIMKSAYPDGLEEKIIATFLREVLKALEYLHSHGHIHRDVKAGNILVDASGAVKLADFGVSACMFDTGDRLRSRNTFVGTPCWMAPEVMEQLHGYDFKADIWSFGITALELAHGHAPFSKYPPMKVLLMTLQNAPPGLDYERDKKFSKSFKEMVAMCLVKDPKKRPSAEKALRHHFFKHACSKDFIARTVLDGLPPLGDRFRTLKLKELDRLAQKKMAYGEKEERSQSEYIRGISAWNFDLEDLKARAVLDDGEIPLVKTVDLEPIKGSEELMVVPSYFESPVMTHSPRVENTKGGGDHVMQVQPGTVLSPLPLQSVSGLNVGRGCVDVYEDDIIADSPTWKECIKTENSRLEATQTQQKEAIKYIKDERHDLEKEHKLMEDIHHASVPGRKGLSGPGVLEHVLAACRGGPGDVDRHLHHQRRTESDQKFSGSSISYGTRVIDSCLEPSKSSGTPDINTYKLEDKPKESVVQQKGRFKVTSEDVDLEEAQSPSAFMHRSSFAPSCNAPSVAISTILPPLHSILQRNFTQTDQIVNLMKYVYPGKTPPAHHLSSLSSKSPSLSVAENFTPEASSSRERELLQQVADLQSRVANLVDELQTLKTKNAQLERQLNAAFNRKEERIKRG